MEAINAKFVSIRDLDDIDTIINDFSNRKLELTRAMQQKNAAQLAPDTLHAEQLVRIVNNSLLATAEDINELIRERGEISLLVELRALLHQRHLLELKSEVLRKAAEAEAQIGLILPDTSFQALKDVIRDVESIPDSNARNSLKASLQEVVQTRRSSLTAQLTQHLQDIKWLSSKEKVKFPADKLEAITSVFKELVDLQALEAVPNYPDTWWAMLTLLQPFAVRFNFHFSKASDTNRISKPEWALNFVEKFLAENMSTLELVIGSTFLEHGRFGVFEVITAVLVPLRSKLFKMVKSINSSIAQSQDDMAALDLNGKLLSHLIFETASFDQRFRSTYKYNPYIVDFAAPPKKWMGLTGDLMLDNDEENMAVTNWLNLELRLAKKRFDTEIIGSSNAFDIDFEFDASSDHPGDVLKPSYSAYGLVKLFDNLTTHFKTISIAKYQLKYVSKIQLTFLDEYLALLQRQFKHFNESLSLKLISNFLPSTAKASNFTAKASNFGAKASTYLPSAAKSSDANATQQVVTNGLKGLEMLTEIYCLIKFVLKCMEEWSEELVFIQLWEYYATVEDVGSDQSIFDPTIKKYNALLQNVFNKYEAFFRKEVRAALKEYVNSNEWNIDQSKNEVSSQLSTFVTTIPVYMSYLKRTLPEVDYFLISTKVCDSYANVMREYVVTNNQFNSNGVAQLQADIEFLNGNLKPILLLLAGKYSNQGNRNYNKVLQSVKMMSHFDAATAKEMKTLFENADAIRSQFDDRLDCLTDSDCLDLLFRIV